MSSTTNLLSVLRVNLYYEPTIDIVCTGNKEKKMPLNLFQNKTLLNTVTVKQIIENTVICYRKRKATP